MTHRHRFEPWRGEGCFEPDCPDDTPRGVVTTAELYPCEAGACLHVAPCSSANNCLHATPTGGVPGHPAPGRRSTPHRRARHPGEPTMTETTDTRWRRKPIEVQAVQWLGDNPAEVYAVAGAGNFEVLEPEDREDFDDDATGACRHDFKGGTWQPLSTGDWVVRDDRGRLFPLPADVFAEGYEPVESLPGKDAPMTPHGRRGDL